MKIKTLLIAGAFAASFMAPDYATAQPKPKKPKPDFTGKKEDAKDDAKEGGKGKPKFDREKMKNRLKAAFDKRKKDHKDKKRKGHKIKDGKAFGKLVEMTKKLKNFVILSKRLQKHTMTKSKRFTSNFRMLLMRIRMVFVSK